jgi:HAD superfamily hydrolase (TIGR01459 family)
MSKKSLPAEAAPFRSASSSRPLHPPILETAGHLLEAYDVLFSDVWGVVHDGHTPFEDACAALMRFRKKGGTVVLVSNAPVPKHRVARMLDLRGVPRSAWDDIVSSGAIALDHIEGQGYKEVCYIGPRDRDAAFFERATARPASVEAAEAIVCTGLEDDVTETVETYRPLLERALRRAIPFVCANPDLVVDVGGRLYPCAGALGDLYERMGGSVFWAGKPHASAFSTAHMVAEDLRGTALSPRQVLAIGDAVRTDLAAAQNAGIDAIFITSGIHRDETMENGAISPEKLARLFAENAPPALAAMRELKW